MKTKIWAVILGAILLVCGILSIWLLWPGEPAAQAEVWSDGKLLYTLDLGTDQTVVVESTFGTNEITVRNGRIAVTAADCPDHYCVERGFCDSGSPIVCLPNRVVIEFVDGGDVDAAVG